MKRFGLIFFALMLLTITGCDGDGDGDSGIAPPPAPGHVPGQEVTIAQGSANAPTGAWTKINSFDVGTSGTLTATLTWEGGPATLSVSLWHPATWTFKSTITEPSPISVSIQVTDALKDAGEEWELYVQNIAGPDITVDYTVTFTAD